MNKPPQKEQVFLFQAHQYSPALLELFLEFRRSVSALGDAWLLFHGPEERLLGAEWHDKVLVYTTRQLAALGYRTLSGKLFPGHSYFLLLKFFLENLDYRKYWLVEYDVRYGGEWSDFFSAFEDNRSDFLGTNIHTFHQMPNWGWWQMAGPGEVPPVYSRLRSFNPLCRFSRDTLRYLHQSLQQGWRGHYEVLVPTLLYRRGFGVEDIGGSGPFVLPGNERRYYDPPPLEPRGLLRDGGTFRYRPALLPEEVQPGRLCHPVKLAVSGS
jgi:hypothetical protein